MLHDGIFLKSGPIRESQSFSFPHYKKMPFGVTAETDTWFEEKGPAFTIVPLFNWIWIIPIRKYNNQEFLI